VTTSSGASTSGPHTVPSDATSQVCLPRLLANLRLPTWYMPLPEAAPSPFLPQLTDTTSSWMDRHSLTPTDQSRDNMSRTQAELLTAVCLPHADVETLTLFCQWSKPPSASAGNDGACVR
jgi:hypothetical protein